MELKKGTLLQGGKYRIETILGQGSFGITYLATATFRTNGGLGEMDVIAKVAVKEFFMSELNSRKEDGSTVDGSAGSVFINYRRKFRKEAENLAKLSHSNIVRVFDVFDENGTSYYVMEYLEGENLDEYIKSQGRLEEDETIKIIKEVGDALSYMHSKKMLHLDMKPKNIMHRKDLGNSLIDFGLSKQYTEDGEPESSTSIGLGTPGYAPLEQAQYSQDGTFPATLDVYALGATMFKMLTGKRPPEATVILNSGFPYKELQDLHISQETTQVLNKSMSPFKRDRYQNVSDFVKDLVDSDSTKEETSFQKTIKVEKDPSHNDSSLKQNAKVCIETELKARNKLTIICLIIGIAWYCMCTVGFQLESHITLWGFFAYSSSLCYLFCSIRLFCNIGLGKFLPFALSIAIFLIGFYRGEDCSIALSYTVIPYIIILCSLLLKKNHRTGFNALKSTNISFSLVRKVWRNRNMFVNILTTIGSLITAFLGIVGLSILYYDTRYAEFKCDDWAFSFMYVSWMIGQMLVTLGYKLGCWILWFGTLLFVGCQFNYGSVNYSAIALIPVVVEQLILLIPKNNKSAISIMV